jgi:ribosomal protein S18 acetylase RimI-like enzyme
MEIRAFRPQDGAAIVALWEACELTRPWNDPVRDVEAASASPASAILVGEQAAFLIASVMVGYDGHRGWIYYLAVHPDWRGRGFGRALMHAAEAWLSARGALKIQLMVRQDNEDAIAFYEKIGMELQPVVTLGRRLDGR